MVQWHQKKGQGEKRKEKGAAHLKDDASMAVEAIRITPPLTALWTHLEIMPGARVGARGGLEFYYTKPEREKE